MPLRSIIHIDAMLGSNLIEMLLLIYSVRNNSYSVASVNA